MSRSIACAALAVSLMLASPLEAQELEDRSPRVGGGLALGLAGEIDSYANDVSTEADLDPSVGFDLRGEVPVLDFLVVGGWFQFMSYEADVSGAEREETVSFDALLRVRWVFEAIADTLFLEPYVLLPFGLSLAILPDDDGSGDDVWPGWNTAVLAGIQVLHGSGFGGYFELGWRHAEVYIERDVPIVGNVDFSLVVNEMALNLGFVYAFDTQ